MKIVYSEDVFSGFAHYSGRGTTKWDGGHESNWLPAPCGPLGVTMRRKCRRWMVAGRHQW